jgi:hypothetical protein
MADKTPFQRGLVPTTASRLARKIFRFGREKLAALPGQ